MCVLDSVALAVCFNDNEEWVVKPIDFSEEQPVELLEKILENI